MAIIKLPNPKDEATLNVTGCALVEGDYGMQIKIDADNGDTLYVPQTSFDRQMDRIGIAEYADAVGKSLHFFRAPNSKPGGKPFWNIDRARPEDRPTPASNGKPPVALLPNENGSEPYLQETGAPPAISRLADNRTIHAKCFREVLEHYVPTAAKAGVELSLEGVSALTFQLYKMNLESR